MAEGAGGVNVKVYIVRIIVFTIALICLFYYFGLEGFMWIVYFLFLNIIVADAMRIIQAVRNKTNE